MLWLISEITVALLVAGLIGMAIGAFTVWRSATLQHRQSLGKLRDDIQARDRTIADLRRSNTKIRRLYASRNDDDSDGDGRDESLLDLTKTEQPPSPATGTTAPDLDIDLTESGTR